MKIEITPGQRESLLDLLENDLIPIIQQNEDIDGFGWLVNIVIFYNALKECKGNED